jgi:hypothetical protein
VLSSKKMHFLTGLVIFADIVIFFVTCGLRPKEWVRHGTGIRHASRARARAHTRMAGRTRDRDGRRAVGAAGTNVVLAL